MNATLKSLRAIGWIRNAGQRVSAGQTATGPGSYGRGVYGGHSTYALDFSTQGSYGRGVYGGHSTYALDLSAQGSYGRGVYASRSTAELDFNAQGSFASDR